MRHQSDSGPGISALIPGFLERRQQDIHLLEALWAAGNYEALQLVAHKLKGNGTSFGFPQITAVGSALETAARAHDGDRAGHLIQHFREILDQIRTKMHGLPS